MQSFFPFLVVIVALYSASAFLMGRLVAAGGLRMDVPNARSSHTSQKPRGGGVVFVLMISVTWLFLSGFFAISGQGILPGSARVALSGEQWMALIAGFAVLGLTGAADDRKGLAARTRFTVQVAVALGVVASGLRWRELDLGFTTLELSSGGSILISVLWIVWSTNLFNFMDGIDGIAGLTGVVIATATAVLAWLFSCGDLVVASIVMVPCIAAFLRFNLVESRIFMGDAGSLPLGFGFSVFMLVLHNTSGSRFALWHGALVCCPFLADATFTLVQRAIRGERFWLAHCDHVYQKLSRRVGSHRAVAVGYALVGAFSAALAITNVIGKR